MFGTSTWLYGLRMWRYRRRHGLPYNHGGMWKPDVRLRREAEQDVVRTSEGWAPKTISPDLFFVAKELAVRYEAAAAELRMHYIQICDLATPEEADERIRRIVRCLDTMVELSIIEQTVRPALGSDIENLPFSME